MRKHIYTFVTCIAVLSLMAHGDTTTVHNAQFARTLPCLILPYDIEALPMPLVDGVSQTNRCSLYQLSNGIVRIATTPEKFWLFVDEKTNLWHQAISNGNSEAALKMSHYYSLSLNDNVRSLRWLAAALALGYEAAAKDLEARASYWCQTQDLCVAFALRPDEIAWLQGQYVNSNDWRSALRLALYYGYARHSRKEMLHWLEKAKQCGSSVATYYIYTLKKTMNE